MKIILEDLIDVSFEYPKTVFFVADTIELNAAVDTLRKRCGYPTFFDESDPNMWDDGWYNFYAEIDLENMKCTDFWASVVANNRDIKDGNVEYHFGDDLEIDFEDVFKQISEQEDLEIVKEYALMED